MVRRVISGDQMKFTGAVAAQDSNFALTIKGTVDLNQELPVTDITGRINNINFILFF